MSDMTIRAAVRDTVRRVSTELEAKRTIQEKKILREIIPDEETEAALRIQKEEVELRTLVDEAKRNMQETVCAAVEQYIREHYPVIYDIKALVLEFPNNELARHNIGPSRHLGNYNSHDAGFIMPIKSPALKDLVNYIESLGLGVKVKSPSFREMDYGITGSCSIYAVVSKEFFESQPQSQY